MGAISKIWKSLLAGGAGVAALAAVNATVSRAESGPADISAGGEARTLATARGRVFYRVAGQESHPPLVLLHGVGAGASSLAWRRNFDALARDFRVYAPDLLGFGFSDKPASAPYSAELYADLVAEFLREAVGAPAHVAAAGLSAAFAVRAADEWPELVRSLVLVAPALSDSAGARADLPGAAFYGLLHSPVLGDSFFNAMTSERSIADHASKQLYFDRRLATDKLVAELYALSHQPGAQYALAAFFSGYLRADARAAFARLALPVTLVWGRQDVSNPVDNAVALLAVNDRARLKTFDRCRAMPQEEHPDAFNALLRDTLLIRSAA